MCTGILPINCDADSLGIYSRIEPARPLVAKVQSNLMISSESSPSALARLEDKWEKPLRMLFDHYTPIVIGFGDSGGSGGSLMRYLKKLPTLAHGIYWCHREKQPDALPDEEVCDVVSKHNGRLVPILGFDEIMLQLWEKLLLTSPYDDLHETYEKVSQNYRRQLSRLADEITALESASNTETARATIQSARTAVNMLVNDTL